MDVHRLDPGTHINNTVGEHFRDQGVKMIVFVILPAVKIMGKDSDDSSILCCCVVSLKNGKMYNTPGPKYSSFQMCRR